MILVGAGAADDAAAAVDVNPDHAAVAHELHPSDAAVQFRTQIVGAAHVRDNALFQLWKEQRALRRGGSNEYGSLRDSYEAASITAH